MAGVKSPVASNTTGYGIVVAGKPVYEGALTNSLKDFLNSLPDGHASPDYRPYNLTIFGVFGSDQRATSQSDIMIKTSINALSANGTRAGAIVVKIGQNENLSTRAQDFINQLVP